MSVSFGCTLLVAAASDLMPLEKSLASSIPPCSIRFTFGSSGHLAEQIRHGADFDMYLAANERFVDGLIRDGAALGSSKVVYATGRLGLYSKRQIQWSNLAGVKTLAIANPQHAPYGAAAKEALVHEKLWEPMKNRIVLGENVRQAFRFAETGNADAAIVAWSLVADRGGRLVPQEWHAPILQSGAIPKRTRNPEAAARLLRFLASIDGQKLLARYGFWPAPQVPQSQHASPAR